MFIIIILLTIFENVPSEMAKLKHEKAVPSIWPWGRSSSGTVEEGTSMTHPNLRVT